MNAMKMIGIEVKINSGGELINVRIQKGRIFKYKILATLHYSSSRKMMSVLVENEDKEIILFSKGSDDAMIAKVEPSFKLTPDYTYVVE